MIFKVKKRPKIQIEKSKIQLQFRFYNMIVFIFEKIEFKLSKQINVIFGKNIVKRIQKIDNI